MNRIPSTQALQCFEASARLGSFTLAGQEMHLTQGGVSRQVIALEQRLGCALLARRRDGLQLTPSGQAYLSEIEPALRLLERATSNVMALKGLGGVLNLSIPASWGNHWLIPRLGGFTHAHSHISLNVFTKIGAADFSNRQIDAAVEYRKAARSDMASEFVMPLVLYAYASPSWKRQYGNHIPPASMLQHTTLPLAWNGWLSQARATQLQWPDPHQEVASGPRYDLMFMAMNAAATGLGAALLPDFMAAPLVAARQLTRLSPTAWQAPGGYFLSQSPLMRSETAFITFRDWLRDQISASA
ncbi:LysR family transcriptional regulator [Variovorax sp. PCZ-1]|uniref:LysR family transcriptional regulator n=1 Tax=Variovorax sp. PCZ-1 TaxID=2835533 RepID=UPI001BD1AF80|nr:LysR family transcriptional regulator [Variovorax sp. PCZ-1]MBS7806285.1 LysR family transcriptional regulator [Variovorax sp. PCZ-1]